LGTVPVPDPEQLSCSPLLAVKGLSVDFALPGGEARRVAENIDLEIAPGEAVALVGESGSGKTILGRAVLGLLPHAARMSAGSILFNGQRLERLDPAGLRAIRGKCIGMVFQEPMVSLNPSLRVGKQLTQALRYHTGMSATDARHAAIEMLRRVSIPNPEECMSRYPHMFSGGMRQRLMLASVMLTQPKLLIADEPTTALDCIIQKEVLDLTRELTRDSGTALLFISHNLSLVAAYTDRVLVMSRGRVLESGPAKSVLSRPQHAYTKALLDALPKRGAIRAPLPDREKVISVRNLVVDFSAHKGGWFSKAKAFRAVDEVSFDLFEGETLAVVGESGSGKTTIGRAIAGLVPYIGGVIEIRGRELKAMGAGELASARQQIQIIFQDPFSSLDPRMTIGDIVAEGLRHRPEIPRRERAGLVRELLAEVGLEPDFFARYVHELSGGQRQRIAIARAVIMRPKVVIADEAVSALDVTVQAQILRLLERLQEKYRFACIFISHDLGVVEQVADRVVVMYRGTMMEEGLRDEIFDRAAHPYTLKLLQAVPELARAPDGGYMARFREYPLAMRSKANWIPCDGEGPSVERRHAWMELSSTHRIACFGDSSPMP
jgi:peptide/nickel transport system ATP-binding protein